MINFPLEQMETLLVLDALILKYIMVIIPDDANGMAHSVDHDQTAPLGAV